MQLTDAVRSFSARLDPAGISPVAVAFSGGGDSLALLVAARQWAGACGRPVLALHVDHSLQPQSRAWADMAEANARRLGAQFQRLVWSGAKPRTGLPAAARSARLRLLAGAARELGSSVLLLGHTADDVAEGEWMREQGGSLGALRVWSPSPVWPEGRGVFHFRPLLDCRRLALRSELTARGLTWIDDPANSDLRFARPRARRALEGAPLGAGFSGPETWPSKSESPSPLDGESVGMRVTASEDEALRMVRCAASLTSPLAEPPSPPTPTLPPSRGKGAQGAHRRDKVRDRLGDSLSLQREDLALASDPWGGVTIERGWLHAADEAQARRALALAATCSSGGEAPPRGDRLDRLLHSLRSAEVVASTIGGAKVLGGGAWVVLARDAGRLDPAWTDLEVGGAQVWDGRFLLTAGEAGWRVGALRGRAARLPSGERQALKAVPATLRPALPVVIKDGETLTCPILAHGPVMATSLAGRRLQAAMGAVQTESQAMAVAHGECGAGDLSPAAKYTKAET